MAIITLNNKENIKNLICFNTCPNIITVEQTGITSTYETIRVNVDGMIPTSASKQSRIIVNGYAINGTDDIKKVSSRRFFRCGTGHNNTSRSFAAISIVNALKSIPQLVMNYNIQYVSDCVFEMTAKNSGSQYHITFETDNITNLRVISSVNGSTNDNLTGTYFSRIYLDLYYNNNEGHRLINSNNNENDFKYLTTLQKEYYKDSVSFNVTPALQSVSSNDNTTIWKATLYGIIDGKTVDLRDISNNYIINGYLVNQGGTYIDMNNISNMTVPALNVNRGTDRTLYNKSILYIYDNKFDISFYKINGVSSENITINYLESDETITYTETTSITLNSNKNIDTYTIELNEDYMRDSYYVDLTFSFGIIRLNIINPPYSNVECNRVSWFNSYGGVSFFDFLGDKKDERKTEVTTYNKSLLDFYKNDKQEQEIVYFRDNEITVSLTSHLMEKDGLYQLYDLQNSYKAWITINGVPYYIIITSLTVEEPSDNVFTATIKYKYSLLDSFA